MRRLVGWCVLVSLVLMLAGVVWADEDEDFVVRREAARKFASLPDGPNRPRFPEGIAADPQTGDIFVATFDFGPNPNKLLRFRKNGKLVAQRDFGGTPLLGLGFNPHDNKVYICNFGASKIQRIAANFTGATTIEDVGTIPSVGGSPAPNALTFNSDGDLFVSDSFQGAIFKIASAHTCGPSCSVTTAKQDGLLATAGFPPFGANGLALSSDENKLFIANTGDDRVLRLDLATGDIDVFAESINGADGIAFDAWERLWVAANQADEIVALNGVGRVVAKLGDFLGIQKDGSARGLLFPASLAIVKDEIFVTNLALVLDGVAGNEPEEDVSTYTISRISIPKP